MKAQQSMRNRRHLYGPETPGETHIQVLQTVPAEGVFAAHAQHLRTALVSLDVGGAHGALLDRQVQAAVATDPAQTRTKAGHVRQQSSTLYLAGEEG